MSVRIDRVAMIAEMARKDINSLVFDYGKAKGYRAAKAERGAAV